MNVGIISIEKPVNNELEITKTLFDKGHNASIFLRAQELDMLKSSIDYLVTAVECIVVTGNTEPFYTEICDKQLIDESKTIFELDKIIYAVTPICDKTYINEVLIPAFNAKSKTYYTSSIFKTFGKSELELQEILKDLRKNKSRIVFGFFADGLECEIHVRYSSKMSRVVVDDMIAEVSTRLEPYIYAYSDITLAQSAIRALIKTGKKLRIAESFTGGAIASALVKEAGASKFLVESLVTYSPSAKISRLGVKPETIIELGAVSRETACEMANGLLRDVNPKDGDDVVIIVTTGNAGPTSEKINDAGHCIIAVGNYTALHICEYHWSDFSREEVIKAGTSAALYRLIQLLLNK